MEAIKRRQNAEKKMKRTKLLDDCINYRKEKAVAQRTLREEQHLYWSQYCSNLTQDTKLSSVWRMAKRMTGINSNINVPTLIYNNVKYDSESEKANLLASTIAEASKDKNYNSNFQEHRKRIESVWSTSSDSPGHPDMMHINEDFELHELQQAIKLAKIQSTPGEDDITYQLLKKVPKSSLQNILSFYNYLWHKGEIPSDWKEAIITPLHKVGTDKTIPASYRPISLTSALCKINERLITTRLVWFLEKNDIISKSQSAYRKQRSTMDQLIRLHDSINKSINTKGHTVGIFFDFSKAFDMVWRRGLIHKMEEHGIEGRIKSWITDFLTNRKIKVRLGNTLSKEYVLENGTPQGSVLSPILFLLI